MTRLGHFGVPALIVAGLTLVAFVMHLSVPFFQFSMDGDSETVTRNEAADDWGDDAGPAAASPNTALAGLIVALAGSIGLMVVSFTRMEREGARWAGWGTTVTAVVGLSIAFYSSMFWVGSGLGTPHPEVFEGVSGMPQSFDFGNGFSFTIPFVFFTFSGGFTGFLETMGGTDAAAMVWVISPAIVAAMALGGLVAGFMVLSRLLERRDDIRAHSSRHLGVAVAGIALLGVTLLVPWSIGELTDASGEDADYFFFGARTILAADDLSDGESFSGLAYTIQVTIAAGWMAFAAGILGTLGGMLQSTGVKHRITGMVDWVQAPVAMVAIWAAFGYVLAWIYMWRPYSGAEGFLPGFFPILVAPIFFVMALPLVGILQDAWTTTRADVEAAADDGAYHAFE